MIYKKNEQLHSENSYTFVTILFMNTPSLQI